MSQTLESHEMDCSFCGDEFVSRSRTQLSAKRRGLKTFCSKLCRERWHRRNPKLHDLGPCPTCGDSFKSKRKAKKYCSLGCFLNDPKTAETLRQNNEAKKSRDECPICGKEKRAARTTCSRQCWRVYLSERFDRWIASPSQIALPQNFDEFLSQETLPCLVDGCEWIGDRLGQHINMVHGITAEEFKSLAGFNKRSGLVSIEESRRMSNLASQLFSEGRIGQSFAEYLASVKDGEIDAPKATAPKATLEYVEHRTKSITLRTRKTKTRTCDICDAKYETFGHAHNSKYCSVGCRKAAYKDMESRLRFMMRCSFCGAMFTGNRNQSRRHERGDKVACSKDCRHKMNIKAALSARGIDHE